ncbi:MAG: cellulase family glycosylhydrolase [Eubacteriales bacterium]|nr:cellulase family glycosylhydrolase [Eubacteriales bacterium]
MKQNNKLTIHGVNLGNWLVLEKWMSPAVFAGTTAEDEYHLPLQLSKEVYEARIQMHRAEYITERDFVAIRAMGMDTIRIPVPYFIFGDREPFIGCIQELDKAFNWAEKYGLKILIDLHTAPNGQNGFDNGGICGVCKWSQTPEEVEFVLTVLERLAERYGTRDGLWGIEAINEPITERMWKLMDVPNRYPPAEPEMAEGSAPNTMDFLRRFYIQAYDRIRKHTDRYFVFHDGFELLAWKDFMQEDRYTNVVLDTHQYLMMAEAAGCAQTVEAYQAYIQTEYADHIREMQQYFPIVCGEWCLFNSLACGWDTKGGQSVLNGIEGNAEETMSPEQRKEIYQAVAKAQLDAWDEGNGYFYWSYKLLVDTVNEPGWIGWDSWDLGRCVDFGWFPTQRQEEYK